LERSAAGYLNEIVSAVILSTVPVVASGTVATVALLVWVSWRWRRTREETSSELANRVGEHLRDLTGNPDAGVRYDTVQHRWLAMVPLGRRGTILMPLARRPRDFRGLVAAAYDVFAHGAPDVVADPSDHGDREVLWLDQRRGWRRWTPCEDCGGYWLSLSLDPIFRAVHARMLATCRPRPEHCLHCSTLHAREGEIPGDDLWYDTVTEQWFTWRGFGEEGGGASWPTGISGYYPPPVELDSVRESLLPKPARAVF
jgi:hypothetical protein